LLKDLGLHGLAPVQDAILAGLVTGEPVLLIGEPGCAKTLLARRLAQSLQLRFHAYDAAKSCFEDLIGFPSPAALAQGRVEYAPTALSIWDKEFILIDEISRASPATANKWLEVIRSRQIMGLPLPNLRYVIAAMNPLGNVCTVPLDMALADRFAFHVPMPKSWQMATKDLRLVVETMSEDDASALCREDRQTNGLDLPAFIEEARKRFTMIEMAVGAQITDYLMAFCSAMKSAKLLLSGRRLGMIRRNVIAVMAVRNRSPKHLGTVSDDIRFAVSMSLPFAAAGIEVRPSVVTAAHALAMKGNSQSTIAIDEADPIKTARSYLQVGQEQPARRHHEVVSVLESSLDAKAAPETVARAFVGLRSILRAVQGNQFTSPADVLQRCVRLYSRLMSVPPRSDEEGKQIIQSYGDRLKDRLSDTAFRLALNVFASPKRRKRAPGSDGEFDQAYCVIREELASMEAEDCENQRISLVASGGGSWPPRILRYGDEPPWRAERKNPRARRGSGRGN
jgi:MoxR-like ATPase